MLAECKRGGFLAACRGGMGNLTSPCLRQLVMVYTGSPGERDWDEKPSSHMRPVPKNSAD